MPTEDQKLRPWDSLSKETVFDTKWFKITHQHMRTSLGKDAQYYILEANDSVICVCVTSDNRIVLEKQYRPPLERVSVDYPAGSIENKDADPEAAIRRELHEEIGFKAAELKKLAIVDVDPGRSTSRLHVFLAKGDITEKAEPEDTEAIVKYMVSPAPEVLKLIDDGTISCAFCISATFLAFKDLGILTANV